MDEMVVLADEAEAGGAGSAVTERSGLRSRLGGAIVRVCEGCERRQRDLPWADAEVASMTEELRLRAKGDSARTRMRVLGADCMKVCPEDGVAVSAVGPMGRVQGLVVRSEVEVEALYQRFRGEQDGDAGESTGELRGRALRRAQRIAAAMAAEGEV